MSEKTELNPEQFNKSLPTELTYALFVTAESLEELAFKCNFIVGRVYEDKETGEGYFISGIKQIITKDKTELHFVGDDEHPRPVAVIHAIILPEFENIPVA